ncbi:hypothetical protein HNY73_013425 [Argiope bruennichi]|uniref:Uncharacterized protein n=1 Tax=Argiope bruennichi TaxID=94029 RepID=A0A8T0EXZ6_ARGBR|nr:hypothetical protein HNY73_013425 [Argiope bruennichi]
MQQTETRKILTPLLILSYHCQALQFAAEENAKILWDKIKSTFTGQAEDLKIDAGNELKNLQMKSNESANDYVARARGIATKCYSLGLDVTPKELVFYTVRGLKGKFSKVRKILKTQRDKSMDEILEILREEENTCYSARSTRAEGINAEVFYSRKKQKFWCKALTSANVQIISPRTVFTGIKILVEVLHVMKIIKGEIHNTVPINQHNYEVLVIMCLLLLIKKKA